MKELLASHKHEHAEVPIMQGLIGRIIGAKGATIGKLSAESGAKIDIDKVNLKVLIRGKPEQVLAAKALIEEIVKTEAARRIQFVVPPDACPTIIGRSGETIRRIEGDTHTRLNIERQSSRITITGDPEDVAAAKALVDEVLEKWTQEREERRSKMIMERTRDEEDGGPDRARGRDGAGGPGRGRGRGRGRGSGRGRGRGRGGQAPNNRAKSSASQYPPGLAPDEEEPRKITGMGPTRAQLKNKKRAQKRAKQRQEDDALDFVTSTPSTGGGFSADDLLSSLGLDLELPPAPPSSANDEEGTSYYKSAGYNLRLDD